MEKNKKLKKLLPGSLNFVLEKITTSGVALFSVWGLAWAMPVKDLIRNCVSACVWLGF